MHDRHWRAMTSLRSMTAHSARHDASHAPAGRVIEGHGPTSCAAGAVIVPSAAAGRRR